MFYLSQTKQQVESQKKHNFVYFAIETLNIDKLYIPIRFWEEKHASIIHVAAFVSIYVLTDVLQ